MASNAALIARLNWVWEDQAILLSGGSWVATETVSLANLLNTRTQSYARSASTAISSTTLTATFGAARRIDHVYIGYHNGTDAARGRLFASGAAPLDWGFLDASLPPGMTCSRSSEASYWTAEGALAWAANNVPRYDHDPLTGEAKGILLEPSTNNNLTYSEDLTQWSATGVTIDADAGTAPDGGNDFGKVQEQSGGTTHGVTRAITWTALQQVVSGFVEADERSWLCIRLTDGTNTKYLFVNATTGAVGHTSAGLVDAHMQQLPGGRWRWSVAWTPAAGAGSVGLYLATANGGDALPSYSGSSGSGLLVWGMQVEFSGNNGGATRPSSYVRRQSDTVLRAGDALLLSGDAFRGVVPAGAAAITFGLQVAEPAALAAAATYPWGVLFDGTSNNRILLGTTAPGNAFAGAVNVGGVTVASLTAGTVVRDGSAQRMAIAVAANDARLAGDGMLSSADTSVAVPAVDRLVLSGGLAPVHLQRLFLGGDRVPDAGLAAGTSDMDDLDAAYPSLSGGWFDLVPTTHAPVGGFVPFGRASADGKVPADERDPRGVSRLVVFDPADTTALTLQVSDRNNPAGYFQFSTLWAGMSARPSVAPIAGGVTLGPVEESRRRRSLGGTLHARRLWIRRRLTVALEWAQEDEALGTWFETAMRSGGVYPVLFSLLPPTTIGATNQERMTILGVLEEPTPVEHQSVDMYRWALSIVEL